MRIPRYLALKLYLRKYPWVLRNLIIHFKNIHFLYFSNKVQNLWPLTYWRTNFVQTKWFNMIVLTAWICHNIIKIQDTLLSPFASIIQGIYTLEIAEFWNYLKPILLKTGQKWTLVAMATVMTWTQIWYRIFLFLTKVIHLAKFHQNLRDAMSNASIVSLWYLYRDTLKFSCSAGLVILGKYTPVEFTIIKRSRTFMDEVVIPAIPHRVRGAGGSSYRMTGALQLCIPYFHWR